MEQQAIQVEVRTPNGKMATRKLRAGGRIPGVLYGHKEAAVSLSLDPHALQKRIRASGLGRNTVFKLEGLNRSVLALLKEAQVHPLSRNLIHVDLIEVREDEQVVVEVPIEFEGRAHGVVMGGDLFIVRRSLSVACSPLNIPRAIKADVTPLGMGQAMHVADLPFPEGVKPAIDPKTTVANIRAPRTEAAAETAVAAEAAPAAAKAPAAAAAKAPAAAAAKAPAAKAPAKK